ncbi:hypothetical protein GH5_00514 [Leishmania sp. Ghana 2012 LV757]|uniref:hypothetical protein n=1 Tax=Leishmania sp. Ghana 2012 LV757 TaxID=2803181 RepID=UPI001B776F2E|nr:hypothetical protein GH5_00514 [Leishmania sp. Ghana 2012 LV757]
MGRTNRQSIGHGVSDVASNPSATVVMAAEASDGEKQKPSRSDRSGSDYASHCSVPANGAASRATLLERLWRQVDDALMDICYTIEDRFTIPQNVAVAPGRVDEEFIQRQGVFMLLGHFMSIIILMAFAAYSRRLSSLMNGASPVMGEILFCVSHLSQVTQEQLGWGLFCSGFLSPSTFDWTATENGASSGVPMSNGAGGQTVRRSMLGPNGSGGFGANGGLIGGSQGSTGMDSGGASGVLGYPYTGGRLVRYLLGRKANNMFRQESLRSYLYCSFYSPSAFLVEQTVWFVFLMATLDSISMQRLAVAAFFANVVGWLPVYSVKSLAGLGSALVVVFMYWIPSYAMDDAVLSITFLQRSIHRMLSAYCASLCITLLFAETLLLVDVRRVFVQGVFTLPQRLLRVGGHHPALTRLVHGCMWLRCEYFYFVDFYFFLGLMCWLSLVLMETAAGISVLGIAMLLMAVPWLVGDGWMVTPLRALKDTVIYVGFYAVTALLLARVVPWSGLAFLSNAVQSVAVLLLMAARCEYKQPCGSAYLLLWVVMMCVYLYEKAGMASGTTGSTVWGVYDSNSPANFANAAREVWYGKPNTEEEALSLLRVACGAFWQLLSKGLSEEGTQLLHFNVVVFGLMLLFSTTIRAVVVEGVRLSRIQPSMLTSAAAASTSAVASTASAVSQVPAATTTSTSRSDDSESGAQISPERHCCLRGVTSICHGSPPTVTLFAKSRVSPHGGGAKASPSPAALTMKCSRHVPLLAAVAAMNDDVNGDGGDGSAAPEETAWAEAITEGLADVEKTVEEVQKVSVHLGSAPEGEDVPMTLPTPPATTGKWFAEDERAPATSPAPELNDHRSKRERNEKEKPSQSSTALLARKPISVGKPGDAAKGEKTHPPPTSGAGGRKAEETAPVALKSVNEITQDASQTASCGESVTCNPTWLTSPMSLSDMSSTPLSSLRHEHAASFTSRSSTNAEILCDSRCGRPEREREKEPLRERQHAQTPASTAFGVSSAQFPMRKAEHNDEPQQQASKPSTEKLLVTEPLTSALSAPGLPLPRSRTEELKKVADPSTDPRVSSRQTAAVKSKEVARGKRAVTDARVTAVIQTTVRASEVPTTATSAAVGAEARAMKGKGEAASDNAGGKKADGKAKAAAGKNNTNPKAAPPPAAADAKAVAPSAGGPVSFPQPKPRHEQAASAAFQATAATKVLPTAAKHAAVETAGVEKRGGNKATLLTISESGAAANARKAVAIPAPSQPSSAEPASKTPSSQSVTVTLPVVPVPLPRSAQPADADNVVDAAQKAAARSERRLEETLKQAWSDVWLSKAESQEAPATRKDEPILATASELKQQHSRKTSTAAHADDAEEPDVSYDLDRVFDFLRLKMNYPAGMDEDDDRSSSAASDVDHRHNPTSFLHSESPELSNATMLSPLTNESMVKRHMSAGDSFGTPFSVFRTLPQPHDHSGSAHESFTPAQRSRSGSLVDITQRVSQPIQSLTEWATKGVGVSVEDSTGSFVSANFRSQNASLSQAPQGTISPGLPVFSTHPNAGAAAASSLSSQPQSTHVGMASYRSAPLPPEAAENCPESAAAARHMGLNAPGASMYYQLSSFAAPPSPVIESRQSSSSHIPFSVSTVNPRASPVPSASSLGRANSDAGTDHSSVLSRIRAAPNTQMAMIEPMVMQKPQRSASAADTVQQMQFAAHGMQQTMMVMMRTSDGQLALYPMMCSQPMYMVDPNGMMQPAQSVQLISQTPPQQQQQHQIVNSAATPRGQAGAIAYQITPDGSYMMTTVPQMSQQMMSHYHQSQEPP